MVAYLKVGPQVRTYSDYLRATREAEKEDSLELSQSSRTQTADGPSKPRTTSFIPLRKLKGNQPLSKKPTIHLAQLEEEADDGKGPESDDPDEMEDAQADEKWCYHCGSPENFIRNWPLMQTTRQKTVKWEGGDGNNKGSPDPSFNSKCCKEPPEGGSRGVKMTSQTPYLNLDPFQQWYGIENVIKVKINGESCMALLDNSAQVNTITLRYVHEHSLEVGPITDLMGSKVTCVGLGNAYTRPLGYVVIWVQVDGVRGYDEDQIALVIPDFSKFAARVPVILRMLTIGQVVNVMREAEMDALTMPWVNARVACLLSVHRMMTIRVDNGQEEKFDVNDYDSLMYTMKAETIEPFSSHIVSVKTGKAYVAECINIMVQALWTQDGSLPHIPS